MKRLVFLSFLMAFWTVSFGQNHAGPVKWLSFEQAVEANQKQKKLLFIDVYTDWCGYCKWMDKNTFSDSTVASVLNQYFYPVKLNAEQREDINTLGTTFKFVASGRSGYHQLAASLLSNKLQYPTLVFMNEDLKIIQAIASSFPATEFHKIILYIGEGHFKKMKWEEWQLVYKSPYKVTPSGG